MAFYDLLLPHLPNSPAANTTQDSKNIQLASTNPFSFYHQHHIPPVHVIPHFSPHPFPPTPMINDVLNVIAS